MSARTDEIVAWLRDQLARSGTRGFVFGLSGGVDSAVVASLCLAAAPGHALGVVMPCHSDPRDEQDAALVATHFGLRTMRVDLGPTYDHLTAVLHDAMRELPASDFPDAARG
ncbi:MAG TPA: asparagine synthase-related protein, partial [Vicinamibacterales bacterium]